MGSLWEIWGLHGGLWGPCGEFGVSMGDFGAPRLILGSPGGDFGVPVGNSGPPWGMLGPPDSLWGPQVGFWGPRGGILVSPDSFWGSSGGLWQSLWGIWGPQMGFWRPQTHFGAPYSPPPPIQTIHSLHSAFYSPPWGSIGGFSPPSFRGALPPIWGGGPYAACSALQRSRGPLPGTYFTPQPSGIKRFWATISSKASALNLVNPHFLEMWI